MNNAIYRFANPGNEPVKAYAPGSSEKKELKKAIAQVSSEEWDIPLIIGGKEVRTGNTGKVVMPHNHKHVLATYHKAGEKEVQMAIDAAMAAHKEWSELPWLERASIMMRVAELFATKYRYLLNASVMMGQSKSPFQAEIDAPCELIDFLRYSAYYAGQIYADQPYSDKGILNRMEYRALEGFVFSLSPFNFTSIASNLNMGPAMMGNVAVWKPSTTAIHSNYLLMKVFQEAGLPDGVINFIPGQGSVIGKVITASPDLAGFHFTGSTATFNTLWRGMANNLENYKSYPKIVGETGGKNFIFVHPSSPTLEVATAIVRGAFEYQGQKCSATSRAYIPKSLWGEIKEQIGGMLKEIKMGDPTDFTNFFNAVIDEASFDNIKSYIDFAKEASDAKIIFGGGCDKSVGYFVEPTVIETTNPQFKSMVEEIFGPVITVYVYDDNKYEETLDICDKTSPYALTGSIFARDRYALQTAFNKLRYSAGNFYINDKSTGAVIAQQPFGGSRASGTNDKAGGPLNLIRWTNPRCIKEALVPPTDYKYPFLGEE
ncbi:1-pyrroline-5-carboxylate dehydrogenase [Parabacteroides sp. PFB2-10]|uniref:L-glutamate gamma-semialdehyde dehydrogenase n=1 Tax=Parabacteroides sp. PFB2-10 TaxID=1742405 RepID=UPI002474DF22|nr:L-glutamate gamma-semialdehyde dehydrogenase [Parabacteroides sp. PFB2-10]MDH6311512.1 1-pyrroline-5-carboxylate dehydrogenase [Parabacteroides sp. PFB2-10]MDL2244440.1 L-glutamate gamma-semialdehyde dehydrogenase [Parabacteroides sp. OttesenSCG-928-J18]